MSESGDSNILHVLVVGFHHKKGCQVEYCYPSLRTDGGTSVEEGDLPVEWSTLPSLAMPDGVHNVDKDTVYFLLPSLADSNQSIYAISCYRQIRTEDLISKTADITRCTVQKSVCVLSKIPLFGLLNAKLELITQAYFNERDFSRVEVLAEMYSNLKLTVCQVQVETQAFVDLSSREFVATFKHRALVLFKLILLEKRVLFYLFPVRKLTQTILVLASLFPAMLERGLVEACKYSPSNNSKVFAEEEAFVENVETFEIEEKGDEARSSTRPSDLEKTEAEKPLYEEEDILLNEIDDALNGAFADQLDVEKSNSNSNSKVGFISSKIWSAASNGWTVVTSGLASPSTENPIPGPISRSYSTLKTDQWGFPLSIFCKGSLCHPYLSLTYLDALQSDKIRSYVFGATNALFKQRKDLVDVIVTEDEDGEMHLDILDVELKKHLTLTTADLRFADYLVKHVCPEQYENTGFYNDTSWEGGDEWVRHQFNSYLLSLYATARCTDQDLKDDFGETFLQAWKTTHNYRVWTCGHYPNLAHAVKGHPFAGQMSVSDVKLRLSHSVHSSEQGRKIAQSVTQTGKYIGQTGKQVRSALGSWFSDLSSSVYQTNPSESELEEIRKEKMKEETASENEK